MTGQCPSIGSGQRTIELVIMLVCLCPLSILLMFAFPQDVAVEQDSYTIYLIVMDGPLRLSGRIDHLIDNRVYQVTK